MIITPLYLLLSLMMLGITLICFWLDSDSSLRLFKKKSKKWVHLLFFILLLGTLITLGALNFQVTLTLVALGMLCIVTVDTLWHKAYSHAHASGKSSPYRIVRYAHEFWLVLLIVWVIRSFIIQPYRVPTGSLLPTVEPGDFLIVNQFAYGLHFPIGNKKIMTIGAPQRGEIALFYYPPNPNLIFVKRVIGLPGDHIRYQNKVLYINGKEMTQTYLKTLELPAFDRLDFPDVHHMILKEENLNGVRHAIYEENIATPLSENFDLVVPQGNYFMMGDNRDNSGDSRIWGFVPESHLVGKAFRIWMSWDTLQHRPRWHRIGIKLTPTYSSTEKAKE